MSPTPDSFLLSRGVLHRWAVWGPAETHLCLAVRRAPNVTDYRRADDMADPFHSRSMYAASSIVIAGPPSAAQSKASPAGVGMSHARRCTSATSTHVERNTLPSDGPGENEGSGSGTNGAGRVVTETARRWRPD